MMKKELAIQKWLKDIIYYVVYEGKRSNYNKMSTGEIKLGCGYQEDYWEKGVNSEAFAQYGRSAYNNGYSLEFFKAIFPETSGKIDEILRRLH